MNGKTFLLLLFIVLSAAPVCYSQTNVKNSAAQNVSSKASAQVKASPAYAEILLRRTERESELEQFLIDYTEEFPKVKEIRFEMDSIREEMDRILAVGAPEAGKLTLALGKLMVRKIEIQTDLWNLRQQYNNDHPEVKRARRKIEIFEKSIKEILQ